MKIKNISSNRVVLDGLKLVLRGAAGSRAQDAIKRLDCAAQSIGLMSVEDRVVKEALDLRLEAL